MADESVAAAKIVGHWLGFAPALLIAALVAAALFQMDGAAMLRLVLALAIGTPALAALGVTAAALTAGLRGAGAIAGLLVLRSEEHTSELQSLMRISYAVFCLKKKNRKNTIYRSRNRQ